MLIFSGEYQHLLDPKRRLAVPAKFRKIFKGKAVITKGMDGCLFLYTTPVWEKLAEKIGQLPLGEKKTRQFVRSILAGAVETEVDGQGRILVPNFLCQFAALKKNIIITGLYDRLEIWDKAKWEKTKSAAEKDKENVAEELGKLGVY